MTTEDKDQATLRKDAELVKNFQTMRGESQKKEKNQKSKSYVKYAVASFAAVFALSMGVVVSGNYDKMKDIESTIRKMELQMMIQMYRYFQTAIRNRRSIQKMSGRRMPKMEEKLLRQYLLKSRQKMKIRKKTVAERRMRKWGRIP